MMPTQTPGAWPEPIKIHSWTQWANQNQWTLDATVRRSLTPSGSTELEHVGRNVDIEDLDQCKVHVHSLKAHPCEGGQQEVVQCCGSSNAQAVVGEGWEPGVEKEDHAQPQQGSWQVDEYLRRVVLTQLPEVYERSVRIITLHSIWLTINKS